MLKWTFLGVCLIILSYLFYHRLHQLDGHWHLVEPDGIFTSLDFVGDHGYINHAVNGNGYFFYHNPWKQELSYHMECLGSEYFPYQISGDQLHFGKHEAVRVQHCNYEWDFMVGIPVTLNLPVVDTTNYSSWADVITNRSLSISIFIGKALFEVNEQEETSIEPPSFPGQHIIPEADFALMKDDEYKICLGYHYLSDPADLGLYIEKKRIKTPENKRDQMVVRVYADQNTPPKMLHALIAELQTYDFAAIYRVFQPKAQHYDYFHTIDKIVAEY